MRKQLEQSYQDIISVENLLAAWQEFIRGKRKKRDVQEFSRNLIDNILQLHNDLANKTYKHGGYYQFKIFDPKPRDISKASVRDRLLHHAVYRILYSFFDHKFIADSFSCRLNKGTHKAIKRFKQMFYRVSRNNTRTCWVLKCDVRKFFANIDHQILKAILAIHIADNGILWLLGNIIDSFPNGLPLGNLTSQLLVNVYMNEFDQFVKHKLKVRYYIRYADDFVILSDNKQELINERTTINKFLETKLKLSLHPYKIILKTFAAGVDYLGWVNFSGHRILRTTTKKRMFKRISKINKQSYLGLLSYGNTYNIVKYIHGNIRS